MKFNIKIETNNEDIQSVLDIAELLRDLSNTLENFPNNPGVVGGKLEDYNGNEVGEWNMNSEETFEF